MHFIILLFRNWENSVLCQEIGVILLVYASQNVGLHSLMHKIHDGLKRIDGMMKLGTISDANEQRVHLFQSV